MIRWTCASVKRRLARYHDGELSIDQRRAVDAHLSTCAACAAAVIELDDVGDALRALAHVAPAPERDAFRAEVMARYYAEQANSWAATLDDWRHDVGLRWAGLSAVGATLSCALILFGIAWLVPLDREGGFTRMPTPTSHDFFLTSYSEPWAPRAGSDAMAAVLSSAQEEDIVLALAAAAGMNAVTIFAFYVSTPTVAGLYTHPQILWLICPILLYWIGRVLMMAGRGDLDDDPIVFAIRDRNSWAAAAFSGACILAAL